MQESISAMGGSRIHEAIRFAVSVHEKQLRKGTGIPYILHPMEAAILVSGMKHDDDLVCAALLHDVVEDGPVPPDEVERLFGLRVRTLVCALSEDKRGTWRERKQHTLDTLGNEPEEVRMLALADKLANLRSVARDVQSMGDALWARFTVKDKGSHAWYYRGIGTALSGLSNLPEHEEYTRLLEQVFGGEG